MIGTADVMRQDRSLDDIFDDQSLTAAVFEGSLAAGDLVDVYFNQSQPLPFSLREGKPGLPKIFLF